MAKKLIYFMLLVGLLWKSPLFACDSMDRVLSKFEPGTRSWALAEGFLCRYESVTFTNKFTLDENDKKEAEFLFKVLMKYQNFDIEAKTPLDLEENYYKYTGDVIEEMSVKQKWRVRKLNGLKSFPLYSQIVICPFVINNYFVPTVHARLHRVRSRQ